MGDKLVDFDEDKQELPPKLVGSQYIDSIALDTTEVRLPINVEPQGYSPEQ